MIISFAWEHEFKFVEIASQDQFGTKCQLFNRLSAAWGA